MKTTITVRNRREGDQLRAGLDDPSVRAFVQVIGLLNGLSTDRARQRVLKFVFDRYDEYRTTGAIDGEVPAEPLA